MSSSPLKKESITTVKNVKISEISKSRKQFLIAKDIDLKPTSFRFKYGERWLKEDTRHFHDTLRKYEVDISPDKYHHKDLSIAALQKLKLKRNDKQNIKREDDEDFTIDAEDKPEDRTIDQILYDDFKAKYVKVLKRNPLKIVWSNRRICQYESLPTRRLNELARKGIDVNLLRNNDIESYHDQFVRCYDVGRYQHENKYYCRNHYKDMKYGRVKYEDSLDW